MTKGMLNGCQSGFQDRDEDQALNTPWGSQLPGGGVLAISHLSYFSSESRLIRLFARL